MVLKTSPVSDTWNYLVGGENWGYSKYTMPVKANAILYGMCYRYQLKKKLNLFKLTPFMVNSVLAEGKGGFIRAKLVCKTLENFFASADEELTIDHVPIWCKNSQGQRVMVEQSEKLVSLQCVQNEEHGMIFVIF